MHAPQVDNILSAARAIDVGVTLIMQKADGQQETG
jgi:hypothetical protein